MPKRYKILYTLKLKRKLTLHISLHFITFRNSSSSCSSKSNSTIKLHVIYNKSTLPELKPLHMAFNQGANVISLVPPPHTKVDAIVSIALDLACGYITVFTSRPNHRILFSYLSRQSKARALGVKIIWLEDSISEPLITLQVSKEILVLNKSGSCLVVMDTDPPETNLVSKTLWSMGVSSKKFVWIDFNNPANSDIDDLLENSIAIRWPFTHVQLMLEAVTLVNKTLIDVPSLNERLLLLNNDTDIDTWRGIGRDLYRYVLKSPLSCLQLPLMTVTIDSLLQCSPRHGCIIFNLRFSCMKKHMPY